MPTTPPDPLAQADVHAQVLTSLGIPIAAEWELTGRAFAPVPQG